MALDHNLANAHGLIGLAKYFLGRGEETEAHIHEALRLSPRDIFAFRWMMWVGIAKVQLNADGEAVAWLRRSIEAKLDFLQRTDSGDHSYEHLRSKDVYDRSHCHFPLGPQ